MLEAAQRMTDKREQEQQDAAQLDSLRTLLGVPAAVDANGGDGGTNAYGAYGGRAYNDRGKGGRGRQGRGRFDGRFGAGGAGGRGFTANQQAILARAGGGNAAAAQGGAPFHGECWQQHPLDRSKGCFAPGFTKGSCLHCAQQCPFGGAAAGCKHCLMEVPCPPHVRPMLCPELMGVPGVFADTPAVIVPPATPAAPGSVVQQAAVQLPLPVGAPPFVPPGGGMTPMPGALPPMPSSIPLGSTPEHVLRARIADLEARALQQTAPQPQPQGMPTPTDLFGAGVRGATERVEGPSTQSREALLAAELELLREQQRARDQADRAHEAEMARAEADRVREQEAHELQAARARVMLPPSSRSVSFSDPRDDATPLAASMRGGGEQSAVELPRSSARRVAQDRIDTCVQASRFMCFDRIDIPEGYAWTAYSSEFPLPLCLASVPDRQKQEFFDQLRAARAADDRLAQQAETSRQMEVERRREIGERQERERRALEHERLEQQRLSSERIAREEEAELRRLRALDPPPPSRVDQGAAEREDRIRAEVARQEREERAEIMRAATARREQQAAATLRAQMDADADAQAPAPADAQAPAPAPGESLWRETAAHRMSSSPVSARGFGRTTTSAPAATAARGLFGGTTGFAAPSPAGLFGAPSPAPTGLLSETAALGFSAAPAATPAAGSARGLSGRLSGAAAGSTGGSSGRLSGGSSGRLSGGSDGRPSSGQAPKRAKVSAPSASSSARAALLQGREQRRLDSEAQVRELRTGTPPTGQAAREQHRLASDFVDQTDSQEPALDSQGSHTDPE